jgi:hypothetical protein
MAVYSEQEISDLAFIGVFASYGVSFFWFLTHPYIPCPVLADYPNTTIPPPAGWYNICCIGSSLPPKQLYLGPVVGAAGDELPHTEMNSNVIDVPVAPVTI